MKTISLIIVGAGSRGYGYGTYALNHPERARVVAVAEPREDYKQRIVQAHEIPSRNSATDWRELVERPRFADAVIIATQDVMHVEPMMAFAAKGYHILLEKPMAPNEEDCRRIAEAAQASNIIFAVCHVLRYTRYTRKIKEMIDSGLIGDVVNIQRLEPVGYWHQAHSFVRGNWRRESESSSMLLAKCCHDLDWIRHIMGVPCRAVHSFGTLKHFRAEEKPEGAGHRCLECHIEAQCPYSAKKIYLEKVAQGETGWPVDVLTPYVTEENVTEALRKGPYGRCVYDCDNDVVDNQVVNMLFEGRRTASLTMTAFTEPAHRQTRIFGTRGELIGDGSAIRHFDFLTNTRSEINIDATDHSVLGGHGGGDYGLMHAFVDAVAHNDPRRILSGPEETLETHLMVFAAERARREDRVVAIEVSSAQQGAEGDAVNRAP